MWNSGLKLVKKGASTYNKRHVMWHLHIAFREREKVVRTKKPVNTRLSELVGTETTSDTGKFR